MNYIDAFETLGGNAAGLGGKRIERAELELVDLEIRIAREDYLYTSRETPVANSLVERTLQPSFRRGYFATNSGKKNNPRLLYPGRFAVVYRFGKAIEGN